MKESRYFTHPYCGKSILDMDEEYPLWWVWKSIGPIEVCEHHCNIGIYNCKTFQEEELKEEKARITFGVPFDAPSDYGCNHTMYKIYADYRTGRS